MYGCEVVKIEDIYRELPINETERLYLRKVTMTDLDDMYTYGSNEKVAQYVFWERHQTKADTKAFIEYILKCYAAHQVAPWGIEYKENGRFIGTVDFVWWQPQHQTAEIGYVLSEPYWGKGIMTEAVHALVRFGFKHMDLVRIQAKCLAENIGSERVMQKSGMACEGTLRKAMFVKGKHRDIKMYSILKEEFPP